MQEPELVLEATAYTIDQLLSRDWRQIALAGRSNVGKSSLINAMARRRTLAKVSSTPGKTRSVNYYAVKPWGFYLVDLPGYGYARASHEERRKWASLLERYLKECRELVCLVLLVDGRLAPQKIDVQLAEYAKSIGLRVIPVLTKADKCKQREIGARRAEWKQILGVAPIVTSSASRFGMKALWQAVCREMDVELPDEGQAASVAKVAAGAGGDGCAGQSPDAGGTAS
ncbi:MAG: ribosome biogenesis GTP-binding protein YihA/YsxC [Desulfovibrio sp.]|jgi:GTP-binding protein|nr:ribosome biogenesis GTP-binding protein YihA/YsxC [Desulfovibrio sp.]